MRKAYNFILLIRPHNVTAAVLSAAVGFSITGSSSLPWLLLASAAVATSAGYVINDYYDIEIDRINRPKRPLPSGVLSRREVVAAYVAMLCFLAVTLFLLPPVQAAWVSAWILLLHIYSKYLKRVLLVGNLLVSAVAASGFLLGSFAGGRISSAALPAGYTMLFNLGREFIKDCEDIEGDREYGASTLPVVYGERAAYKVSLVIFCTLAVAFPLPYFFGYFGLPYMVVISFSIIPILAVSAFYCFRGKSPSTVSVLLKVGMFFGILAFYLGGLR